MENWTRFAHEKESFGQKWSRGERYVREYLSMQANPKVHSRGPTDAAISRTFHCSARDFRVFLADRVRIKRSVARGLAPRKFALGVPRSKMRSR